MVWKMVLCFVIGIILGGCVGVMVMAVVSMAKEDFPVDESKTKGSGMLDRYKERLDYEISTKTSPFEFMFMMGNHMNGNFTDEDIAEVKGYYSGLKVAREMLERTIEDYKGDEA